MSPAVSELLRRLSAAMRRNKDLSTRVVQLRASRDKWRAKALERQRLILRERSRTRHARISRDMWRARATHKGRG